MEVKTSPQHIAVGEGKQLSSDKDSYASKLNGQKVSSSVNLCPIFVEHGIPIVEFSVDEVNAFTREEGLHHAVIFKFSYGKPEFQDLCRLLPKHFDVKGMCNMGQLEYRHILVRFDLFEDYANVVSKSSGFIKSKGEEFFFRSFPWTMDFNPREETSKAVTWVSFPDLPANFLAKRSIMSIASVVGKPIAIDKATQDRTRPSTTRVKILINLLDKHPKIVKLKIVDKKSGRIVEYDQRIVFDNLPKYCTGCHHQGHDAYSCRRRLEEENDQIIQRFESEKQNSLGKIDESSSKKLQGDARDFLNIKRKAQEKDVHNKGHLINAVWKQKPVSILKQSIADVSVCGRESVEAKEIAEQEKNEKAVDNSQTRSKDASSGKIFSGEVIHKKLQPEDGFITDDTRNNVPIYDQGHRIAVVSRTDYSKDKIAIERGKKSMSPVTLKPISMKEFKFSLANSSYAIGSVSGTKYENVQQFSYDQTGQAFSGKAKLLKNRSSDIIQTAFGSAWVSKRNGWTKAHLQSGNLEDQSKGYDHVDDFPPEPRNELAHTKKSISTVPLKVTDANEDNGVDSQSAASISQHVIIENMQNNTEQNDHLDPNTEKKQQRCNDGSMENAEKSFCSTEESFSNCKEFSPLCSKKRDVEVIQDDNMVSPLEVSNDLIKERSVELSTGKTGHLFVSTRHSSSIKEKQQGQCTRVEGHQLTNNALQKEVDISPRNSRSENQDNKLMGELIKKVQSYTPLSISSAYSGEDLNDNEDFSSLEGNNKQLIVANMRELVIKSKLWDQQQSAKKKTTTIRPFQLLKRKIQIRKGAN